MHNAPALRHDGVTALSACHAGTAPEEHVEAPRRSSRGDVAGPEPVAAYPCVELTDLITPEEWHVAEREPEHARDRGRQTVAALAEARLSRATAIATAESAHHLSISSPHEDDPASVAFPVDFAIKIG